VLSLAAWNIWHPFSLSDGTFVRDDTPLWGITPRMIGVVLVLIANAVIARFLWRSNEADRARAIITASAASVIAFFMLATQMHERYLFAFFPFAAILLAHSRPWRVIFLCATMTFFFNLAVAFFVPTELLSAVAPVASAGTFINLAAFALILSLILFPDHDLSPHHSARA
jgi:hypothetical protein